MLVNISEEWCIYSLKGWIFRSFCIVVALFVAPFVFYCSSSPWSMISLALVVIHFLHTGRKHYAFGLGLVFGFYFFVVASFSIFIVIEFSFIFGYYTGIFVTFRSYKVSNHVVNCAIDFSGMLSRFLIFGCSAEEGLCVLSHHFGVGK